MSRPWRDEVAIYVAPRKLALLRRARGLRPRVVAATELTIPPAPGDDLGPVLAHLAELLADQAWHGAAVRAVVADHPWARYGIVAWPGARLDAEGRLARARYALGDAYGDGMADWTVTLADTPPGRALVACAMPPALRGALEDVLAPAGLALVSLQPGLVAAFNASRDRLPAEDAWFVAVEDASLAAVHLSRGAWDRVHLARLSSDLDVELERLRAVGALAGASGPMFVDAPARLRGAARAGIDWLSGDDDGEGRELALLRRLRA